MDLLKAFDTIDDEIVLIRLNNKKIFSFGSIYITYSLFSIVGSYESTN